MPQMDDGRLLGVRIGDREMAERRATDPNFTYTLPAARARAAILLAPERPLLPPITAAVTFQFIFDRLTIPPRQ